MDTSMATLPPPMDMSHLYSEATKDRNVSTMKGFYKYFRVPGVKNIAGGLPNNNYFPYDTLEATAAPPNRWEPTPMSASNPSGRSATGNSISNRFSGYERSRVLVPKVSTSSDVNLKIDLQSALQYGTAIGYPPLYEYIETFVRNNLHPNFRYEGGPGIILTTGNTDGLCKTLEAFSNPWHPKRDSVAEREGILVEEFAYMSAIQTAKARGLNIVPVAIDEEGMCNEGLDGLLDVLENWDLSRGKRPHLLYTVTVGQNPTSGVLSLCRRRAIYDLCMKYDVIIIEDDPYWFLQYPSANDLSQEYRNQSIAIDCIHSGRDPSTHLRHPHWHTSREGKHGDARGASKEWRSSGFPFLDSLIPSYLAVDVQGRVVRLDTFSKTIAPGCRLGWITAQPRICERLLRITETTTQQPSGFVQAMVAELLIGPQESRKEFNIWETGGWVRWLEGLRGAYERRMQAMCKVLENGRYLMSIYEVKRRHSRQRGLSKSAVEGNEDEADAWTEITKTPLYDFPFPQGGMFVWLHFNFPSHPLYRHFNGLEPRKTYQLAEALFVYLTRRPHLVLYAPGVMFAPTSKIREEKGWQYARLCFAAVEESEVADCSRRFVEGVRSFWEIRDPKVVDALLGDDAELGWGPGQVGTDDEKIDVGVMDLRGGC